ncbi:MAG: hypothetical protein V1928_03845 [Parcubacteria group bacterium]
MNGNELEENVEKMLKNDGWEMTSEVFYTDPNTKKPREKDIIARKSQNTNNYDAVLFVECKSIPKATRIYPKGKMDDVANTLFAYHIPFADISEIERHKQTHFYQKYCEFFKTKDDKDFLHVAINQNLQSFSAFRKDNKKAAVYYLLVVYDGNVFYIDDNSQQQDCHGALVRVDTLDNTFNLVNKGCFIEIVSILDFENLLKKIEEDITQINQSAFFYRDMHQKHIASNRKINKTNRYE